MPVYVSEHHKIYNPNKEPDPIDILIALNRHGREGKPLSGKDLEVLKGIVARYFLACGPSGPNSHINPLRSIRERLVNSTRRRVVQSIRNWQIDRREFASMPTTVIEAWFKNEKLWMPRTRGNALDLSFDALAGTKFEAKRKTLENVIAAKHASRLGNFATPPRDILELLQLPDPEELFGLPEVATPNKIAKQLENANRSSELSKK